MLFRSVEIMVEVLAILAIATKEVKRGRFSELIDVDLYFFIILADWFTISEKYFRKLMGNSEIEGSLERLDRLTLEEARMASAEQLKMTHSVGDRVRGVEGQVQGVRDDMQGVGNRVQDVNDRVRSIDSNVRGVDDKLDQANRSSSSKPSLLLCGLRQLHREPAQRQSSTMAFASKSIHKS